MLIAVRIEVPFLPEGRHYSGNKQDRLTVRKKEMAASKEKRREKNKLERRQDNGLNLLVLAVIYQLLIRYNRRGQSAAGDSWPRRFDVWNE
jgi:hypothetical protein